jgi:hypothetical protein
LRTANALPGKGSGLFKAVLATTIVAARYAARLKCPKRKRAMSKVLCAAATIAAFGFIAMLMTVPRQPVIGQTGTVFIMEDK